VVVMMMMVVVREENRRWVVSWYRSHAGMCSLLDGYPLSTCVLKAGHLLVA
jgi:hypothetical protein